MAATLRLGIAGLGAIGFEVARRVASGGIPGIALVAVSARDVAKARAKLESLSPRHYPLIVPVEELSDHADIILECAPASVFARIARTAVERGKIFLPLSVGQLLTHVDLVEKARQSGAKIIVPTGALLGLDAVRAVSEGVVHSVKILTRKPPAGLAGAPHLIKNNISLDQLAGPLKVFEGSARDAIQGFPANVNVAVALSLAGIGPDRTTVEIWADPGVTRNTHTIEVKAIRPISR